MSGPDLDRMERVVVEGRADITAGLARAEVVSGASLPELVQGAEAMKATMAAQQEPVPAAATAGLSAPPTVLVGGSAPTPAGAHSVGAAHAENAQRAVEVAAQIGAW